MYMCIEVNCVLETVANIVVKFVMCVVYILMKCRQMMYMYELCRCLPRTLPLPRITPLFRLGPLAVHLLLLLLYLHLLYHL